VERLFTPWRHAYVTGTADSAGCVFCQAQTSTDAQALVVHEGRSAFVILNLYPYNSGHLMVVARRHVPTLSALDHAELVEMAELTQACERVLTEAYRPQGLNVGINVGRPAGAGVADHLHVHLVPRWTGDTSFMSIVGQVRVLPEELTETAGRLRPLFARLAGGGD
jgi:ATP adenylyltransferase